MTLVLEWGMNPTAEDIQRVTDALVQAFQPQKVILFGSRARGDHRDNSDVDLMVILPFEGSPVGMMSKLLAAAYKVMGPAFALECHPRLPLRGDTSPDPVMKEALMQGRVLYEAAA